MRLSETRLRAARWATRVQFAVLGFVTGTWGVHIPNAKAHFGIDTAQLSLALLAAAAGAVACLLVAGRAVAALGTRTVALTGGLVASTALGLIVIGDAFAWLIVLMVVFGGAGALLDVAINTEGSALEARSGKKVMSGFHGMFSLGGMAGAGAGAWLMSAAVPASQQLAGAGATAALATAAASLYMLRDHAADTAGQATGWQWPRGTLAVLGLLAAVGMVAEGAMYDWSVLYLQSETAAAPALAALGYASFSGAMAATRFAGDTLRTHIPAPRLLAGSGLLAAAAMAVVLLVRDPVVGLIGFALVGAGLANVVPLLFMAATQVPGVAPASAIAVVSSVGYVGFMIGPPLVGGLAHRFSLSGGLVVVVAGALLLAAGARRLPR